MDFSGRGEKNCREAAGKGDGVAVAYFRCELDAGHAEIKLRGKVCGQRGRGYNIWLRVLNSSIFLVELMGFLDSTKSRRIVLLYPISPGIAGNISFFFHIARLI